MINIMKEKEIGLDYLTDLFDVEDDNVEEFIEEWILEKAQKEHMSVEEIATIVHNVEFALKAIFDECENTLKGGDVCGCC